MTWGCEAFKLLHEENPQYKIPSRFQLLGGAEEWLEANFPRHKIELVHHANQLMKQQHTDRKILVCLQNVGINWPFDYERPADAVTAFEDFFAKAVGLASSQIHICFSAMGKYGGTTVTVCLCPQPKEFAAVMDKVTRETFVTRHEGLGTGGVRKLTHGNYDFLESSVVSEWGWLGAFWDWTKKREGREIVRESDGGGKSCSAQCKRCTQATSATTAFPPYEYRQTGRQETGDTMLHSQDLQANKPAKVEEDEHEETNMQVAMMVAYFHRHPEQQETYQLASAKDKEAYHEMARRERGAAIDGSVTTPRFPPFSFPLSSSPGPAPTSA